MPRRPVNRERLLEEGHRLLTQQGFAATGVQEITDAAEVPKGSFYNYFPSKEDFAIAVLERYRDQACEALDEALGRGPGSPLTRLRAFFDHGCQQMAANDFGGGCLAGRLAQELAGEHACFRTPLDQAFQCIQERVQRCLEEARTIGELAPSADPATLSEFIVLAWQGAMLRAKASHSVEPLEICRNVILDQLLPRKEA